MMRWTRMTALAIVAFALISFVVDLAVFKLSGSPCSRYTVSHFISAPLKNDKQEIDYTGSEDVACSLTMYPQGGFLPCWYLKRHTNQVSTY